jgi:hypothetical protein
VTNSAGNHGIEYYAYEAIIASQVSLRERAVCHVIACLKAFSHRKQAIILQLLQDRCDLLMGEKGYLSAISNSASNSFTSAPPIPNPERTDGRGNL